VSEPLPAGDVCEVCGTDPAEIDRIRAENESLTAGLNVAIASMQGTDVKLARVTAERDKLQRFKDWVHKYLDDHGVPHHPPGTHGAEGCRIGDRMDWLMNLVDELRRAHELLEPLLWLRQDTQHAGCAEWNKAILAHRAALALLAKSQAPAAPEGERG
jgi:hypothetical protein